LLLGYCLRIQGEVRGRECLEQSINVFAKTARYAVKAPPLTRSAILSVVSRRALQRLKLLIQAAMSSDICWYLPLICTV
jgi:hypothetical protein